MDLKARIQITRKDFTPIPTQETIMQHVPRHKYRSVIDMSNAYYQVRVEEEDEQNNTITAGLLGAWQVKVMLQGDCNAPATMMRIMNTIFSDHLGDFIWIYLDDIVIFSNSKEEHIRHLRHVFDTLRKYEFYLRMDKCNLMTDEINLLGHTIISKIVFRPDVGIPSGCRFVRQNRQSRPGAKLHLTFLCGALHSSHLRWKALHPSLFARMEM